MRGWEDGRLRVHVVDGGVPRSVQHGFCNSLPQPHGVQVWRLGRRAVARKYAAIRHSGMSWCRSTLIRRRRRQMSPDTRNCRRGLWLTGAARSAKSVLS